MNNRTTGTWQHDNETVAIKFGTVAGITSEVSASPASHNRVLLDAIDAFLAGEIDRDELRRIRFGGKPL